MRSQIRRSGPPSPQSKATANEVRSKNGLTSLRCRTGSSHFTSRSRAWSSRNSGNMLGAGHKHNCGNSHGSNLCRSNGCYCCLPAHRLQRRLRRHRGGLLPDPRLPADGHRRHRLLCNSLLSLQSERRLRIEEGFWSCPLRRSTGVAYSIHSKKIDKNRRISLKTGCLGGRFEMQV